MQKFVINQGKESNCTSHLVYYFTLSHMHFRDCEILTKGSLTLTLMPYLFFLIFYFWWYYFLVLLGFLICPCNEPLIDDSKQIRLRAPGEKTPQGLKDSSK